MFGIVLPPRTGLPSLNGGPQGLSTPAGFRRLYFMATSSPNVSQPLAADAPPAAPLPRPSASTLTQTWRFFKDPMGMLRSAREECGDIFCLRVLGFGDWVFVCSPQLAREMFRSSDDHLSAGDVNHAFLGHVLGKNSFFNMDGEDHARRRRTISPPLIGKEILQQIKPIREIAERCIDEWPEGEARWLLPLFNDVSLEIMLKLLFGDLERERLERLAHLSETFFEVGLRSPIVFLKPLQWNLGPWSPWGKVLRMRKELFTVIGQEIDERLEGRRPTEGGVLGDLLQIEGEHRLSREALIHEMVTITFGAQEATGKILAWTLVAILTHPPVHERVMDELREVVGDGPIESEHLSRLPYLEAVIQEGIRYRPLSPMAGIRRAHEGSRLGGYEIPAGTMVSHGFAEIAQDPQRFPNPKEYDPEHFFSNKLDPYTFNPFGGGTRRCLGKRFAEMEMQVILATALRAAELEVIQDSGLEPVRQGLLFAPQNARARLLRKFSVPTYPEPTK